MIIHFLKMRLLIACLASFLCLLTSQSSLYAQERDLTLDVMGVGPFSVGSTNFTTIAITPGVDAGQYQQGLNQGGNLLYINALLAFEDASFSFQLSVPDDSVRYGASAGTTLPYSAYVLYPTTEENTRADYEVFIPPALPHMQGQNESPIFADDAQQYPLVVYSHGVGSHPTAERLSFLKDLASHGYIVLALYHGDNRFGQTEARQFNLRPLAVKAAIDKILVDPDFGDHIDATRIGGVGESFGGATMMALLGARKVNPDFLSVASNALHTATIDSRIVAASSIVPYAGKAPYAFFGVGGTGAGSIDRPFMANSANADSETDFTMVEAAVNAIPGVKYLVEYDGEDHAMSEGAVTDAYTWTKLFLDAFVKKDAVAIDELSRVKSVNGSGSDSLSIVTDPEPVTDTNASTAAFANNILSVPAIAVLDKYYSLDLNYIADSNPVQFGLSSVTEIASQSATSGSFANGVLVLPVVDVAGTNYRIELTLVSESPALFNLTFAE